MNYFSIFICINPHRNSPLYVLDWSLSLQQTTPLMSFPDHSNCHCPKLEDIFSCCLVNLQQSFKAWGKWRLLSKASVTDSLSAFKNRLFFPYLYCYGISYILTKISNSFYFYFLFFCPTDEEWTYWQVELWLFIVFSLIFPFLTTRIVPGT